MEWDKRAAARANDSAGKLHYEKNLKGCETPYKRIPFRKGMKSMKVKL